MHFAHEIKIGLFAPKRKRDGNLPIQNTVHRKLKWSRKTHRKLCTLRIWKFGTKNGVMEESWYVKEASGCKFSSEVQSTSICKSAAKSGIVDRLFQSASWSWYQRNETWICLMVFFFAQQSVFLLKHQTQGLPAQDTWFLGVILPGLDQMERVLATSPPSFDPNMSERAISSKFICLKTPEKMFSL